MLLRQLFTATALMGLLMGSLPVGATDADEQVQSLESLEADSAIAQEKNIPILLVFVAEDCPFCEQVEELFLQPMLRSGDYTERVIIRHVHIDGVEDVIDHNGKKISQQTLQDRYDVFVTPTLVFVGPTGKEVGERLTGINSVDYYGAYLDRSIEEGSEAIKLQAKK